MKLYSQKLELSAIRTICGSKSDEVQALTLASLTPDFFYYEPTRAAFQRIQTVAKKRGFIVSYTELLEDPALNEEFRDIIRDNPATTIHAPDKADRLVQNLDKYRKVRTLYEMSKRTLEALKAESVEVDELLDKVTSDLTEARSRQKMQNLIHTIGHEANALDLVDKALDPSVETLYKTGFTEFDERNGGLPTNGVLLLAATTSGGKSAVLMNMLTNMYFLNKVSVANFSLEMDEKKITRRLLSRQTQIPFWKFVKGMLSPEERKKAKRAWREIHKFGEENECMYSLICPTHSVSSTEALTLVRPYGYKIIGLDYVGLMTGADGDDQWKALGRIVRECKIFSKENDCLVIVLAQLDAGTEKVRYSQTMLEHADNMWKWNYSTPEKRETKILDIIQGKGRDQELFNFPLKEAFEIMSVLNLDDEVPDLEAMATKTSSKSPIEEMDEEPEIDYDAGQK